LERVVAQYELITVQKVEITKPRSLQDHEVPDRAVVRGDTVPLYARPSVQSILASGGGC
jgi:hypothetical protein